MKNDLPGNKPICFITGAGEHYNTLFGPRRRDLVIAADGGYSYLKDINVQPDIIIGDFDSLGYEPIEAGVIALPAEKDVTDTAAAIDAGWRKGFRIFHIYGGTGGRPDHTIANIQLMAAVAENGGEGYLFDKDFVITAVHNGEIKFSPVSKGYISVFSHSGVSYGVCESGLKYCLSDFSLSNSDPLGVSNEFIGKDSLISVKNGTLIVVYPKSAEITGRS